MHVIEYCTNAALEKHMIPFQPENGPDVRITVQHLQSGGKLSSMKVLDTAFYMLVTVN